MRTVYTAPNGTTDVVATAGGFRVRVKTRTGGWVTLGQSFTATYQAREVADDIDRFRPDGTGRFPVS